MSQMTTAARPYALAAFDFAVENKSIDEWQTMLAFASEVATNENMHQFLVGAAAASKVATIFNKVCGDQLSSKGQNLERYIYL